jgi:regulator of sigma E protease
MDIVSIIKTVVGISLLIVLHELGHFGVARLCGMRVLRFSIGFGPSLLSRRFGETLWQVAIFPLGGYVHIDGMGPREEAEADDGRSFRAKPVWQRMLVIFAGPAMNWVLAATFIFLLASTVGAPRPNNDAPVVGEVGEASPAAAAGIAAGDRIVSAGGTPIDSWTQLVGTIQENPEKPLEIVVERSGQRVTLTATPARDKEVGRLGVAQMEETVRLGVLDAAVFGVSWAWRNTGTYASLLWGVLTGTKEGEISGVPGIIKLVSAQAKRGLRQLLQTLAWLSIGLCLLNLAPVPALDGGRLLFLGIETVRGKPVDERIEGIVHAVGFVLIFGLLILVSVRDVWP